MAQSPSQPPRKKRGGYGSRTEARMALLFLLPTLLLVLTFRVIPLIWGFFFSLTDADGVGNGDWVGAANYQRALTDPNFQDSIVNTLLLIATLPIWVMLPMLLAILIHQGVPGSKIYRAVYFLPAVLSSVVIGSIFKVILRYAGSLNNALEAIGIDAVDWLGGSATALGSLIAVQLWSTFGMGVLIFLSGLATVPDDIIEAARIDGARFWQRLFLIIVPSLRPIIEFVAIVTTIGVLTSMFGLIYVLTGGGPGTATTLPEFLIWLEQGKLNRPGYAAAISMILFVLMAGIAWLQVRIMTRNAAL